MTGPLDIIPWVLAILAIAVGALLIAGCFLAAVAITAYVWSRVFPKKTPNLRHE